ncbi:MAG: hypothetical protein JOS17DRAFT_757281 [Linnemannia elongata]|nr:MAG: hypothetical protein JOS17DRAFT_757281 [Linnemannia elongata]
MAEATQHYVRPRQFTPLILLMFVVHALQRREGQLGHQALQQLPMWYCVQWPIFSILGPNCCLISVIHESNWT